MNKFLPILLLTLLTCCSSDQNPAPTEIPAQLYFPPISGSTWESTTPESLQWDDQALSSLLDFLEEKNSKSFMILIDGKIVVEEYFNGHSETAPWYWASAGKTLTTAAVGVAQQENFLNINNKVSDYIGAGWTSAPAEKESLIKVSHLLSMSSGLDDTTGDDVSPSNLHYVADAGTRWAYHNVYVKLQDVVAAATGSSWDDYFNAKIRNKIGMNGVWNASGGLSVYWSNTRSMARFGLLMLNNGKWEDQQIIPADYAQNAIATSQNLNLSYGYMWWLNGKASYRLPQSQLVFPGSLISSGSADMVAALGKNGQKIYIVPSKKMVVIRMGNSPEGDYLGPSAFDSELWEKINLVIN